MCLNETQQWYSQERCTLEKLVSAKYIITPHTSFSPSEIYRNKKNSNVILTENHTLNILKQIPKVINSTLKKLINRLSIILTRMYKKQIKKEIFRIERESRRYYH